MKFATFQPSGRPSFSLVELLVVFAIIAILAGLVSGAASSVLGLLESLGGGRGCCNLGS